MKHCPKCGAQLADDDDYCYFCGNKLEEEIVERTEASFSHIENSSEQYRNNYDNNTPAVVGFVMSFIFPIVGLVLSIIGLKNSKRLNGKNRSLAIAGIIISILNYVITLGLYFIIYMAEGGQA